MVSAVFCRYVSLGDSLTEGLGDDRFEQDRIFAGWADRLAALLSEEAKLAGEDFLYANLAVRGRKSHEILSDQVAQALLLQPDLVTIMASANDLWKPRKHWEILRAEFSEAITSLQAVGVTVVLTNVINPSHLWSFFAGARHARNLTKLIEEVAEQNNVTVVDVYRSPTLRRLRVWSADHVYFGARGHAHLANKTAKVLGLPFRMEQPVLQPNQKDITTIRQHLVWFFQHISPFGGRRVRGFAAVDGLTPKRPVLSRVHEHPWTIRRSNSFSLVKTPHSFASLLRE